MAWVGSHILPHEAAVRAWLKRWTGRTQDIDDVIQRLTAGWLRSIAWRILAADARTSFGVSAKATAHRQAMDGALRAPHPERHGCPLAFNKAPRKCGTLG